MCGVLAEGSSRICHRQQQHPPQPRTNNTDLLIHGVPGVGSVRTMTHSPEEVHRRWWWRRGPGIEPQSSSVPVSQPQHPHCVNNITVQHDLEHQKHPSLRLACPPDIICRKADTTCSSVNKTTYSRSYRSILSTSRSINDGDSSSYELGSRELEFNKVNGRLLCTDTLEHISFCTEYSSLENGCNVVLCNRTSRKASSNSVDKFSVYSNDSRKFSLVNSSLMPSIDCTSKLRCSTAIRQPSHSSTSRRFCGLSSHQWIVAFALLFLASFTGVAESCSSRSTPKPRPPSPTSRPNVTFLTYACPPAYAAWYCLNGATCFTVKIGDSILYNCECADGYMGQRCEFKDLDGSYLPARDKVLLQTASIAGGATLAVVLVFIVLFSLYVVRQRDKENKYEDENSDRKPFSGYQNLHSDSLCINNPYVQIEDLNDVKIVPSSSMKILHNENNSSNIKEIICSNMNSGSNIIVSASNNKNIISSLHTPS